MSSPRVLAPLLLALLLAGSAAADPPPSTPPSKASASQAPGKNLPRGKCIDTTFTNNWVPLDDHTLLIRTLGQAYRVTTSQCQSLSGPMPRITTVMRGGSSICGPLDADLYVANDGDIISTPCFMQSIEPITPEQAKALEQSRRK